MTVVIIAEKNKSGLCNVATARTTKESILVNNNQCNNAVVGTLAFL